MSIAHPSFYRITQIPDIRMPHHQARHGGVETAWARLSLAVYEYAAYLLDLVPPETMTVTLRYSYDPGRKGPDRLRLYLLVTPRDGSAVDARALAAATGLLELELGMDGGLEAVAPDETAGVLDRCTDVVRLDLRDQVQCVDAAEGDRLEPVYRIAHLQDLVRRGSASVGWDALLDRSGERLVVDLALARVDWWAAGADNNSLSLDLYSEVRDLAGKASARTGLMRMGESGLHTREEAQREKRSLGAERVREDFRQVLDGFEGGPVYAFNLRVAGGDACRHWARLLAIRLAPDGSLVLRPSSKEPDDLKRLMRAGAFFRGYRSKTACYTHAFTHLPPCLRGYEVPARWKRLSRIKTLVGTEVARELLRLPVPRQGGLKSIWLESEQRIRAGSDEGHVRLGVESVRPVPAIIPLSQLNKHLFVAGVTGSGKTTTVVEILCALARQNIPFLVIEPTKKEYRALARHPALRERLRVYTCGDERLSPLKLNPFEFDREQVTLDEHLGVLEACFKGALPLFSPLTEILLATLEQAYIERGWRAGRGDAPFPGMGDLVASLGPVLDEFKYSDRLAMDIRTAARVRLTRLTQRAVGSVFQTRAALPPIPELLRHPTVIELDRLSQEHANLVTLFLLQGINRHLRLEPSRDLRHVLVIEEAHNIVGTHAGAGGAQENVASPQAEAAAFMVKMLAEVRALGMGIIIADQTPAAVAPEVMKNTGVKVIHRTVSGDDRACVAESMLLDDAQTEELARLATGECFLYHEWLYRPQRVRVASPADAGLDLQDMRDPDLLDWLGGQDWHRQACRTRLEERLPPRQFERDWQPRVADYRALLRKWAGNEDGLAHRHRLEAMAAREALDSDLEALAAAERNPVTRALLQQDWIDPVKAALAAAERELLPPASRDAGSETDLSFLAEVPDQEAVARWRERVAKLRGWLAELEETQRRIRDWLECQDAARAEQQDAVAAYRRDMDAVGDLLLGERWRALAAEMEAAFAAHPRAYRYFVIGIDEQRWRFERLVAAAPRGSRSV